MSEEKILMPKHLTAENGAKYLLIGEFKESTPVICPNCLGLGENQYLEKCEICSGEGELMQDVYVNWATIKAIYDMAVKNLGEPTEE